MKLPAGIETKVGAGFSAGTIVTAVFGFAGVYHWFTPPPSWLATLTGTILGGIVAYFAPHTHRRPPLSPLEKSVLDRALSHPPAAIPASAIDRRSGIGQNVTSPPVPPTPSPPKETP